jgi:hypothetical protein
MLPRLKAWTRLARVRARIKEQAVGQVDGDNLRQRAVFASVETNTLALVLLWAPAAQFVIGALDKAEVEDFIELDRSFNSGDFAGFVYH